MKFLAQFLCVGLGLLAIGHMVGWAKGSDWHTLLAMVMSGFMAGIGWSDA